jgi:microcin C transport system substrate-binding protein
LSGACFSATSRRDLLKGIAGGAVTVAGTTILDMPAHAVADLVGPRHGMSIFGDLKYPVDFTHLAYVNPDAPKLGRMTSNGPGATRYNQNETTFDSFNTLILKGRAPALMDQLVFDSLMVRAYDEPDAVYGLIAESVVVNADRTEFRFKLRPEARFQDGSPITAQDVAFTLMLLKEKGHPQISETIKPLASAVADGPGMVVVAFEPGTSHSLPQFVATLPILSKAYYATHDFEATTLDPPLGSGPYKIGNFEPGRFVEFARVKDYWAKDLPVRRGQFNFDIIRYDMYRERAVAFEAFKAGQYLLREEFTARVWATEYNFPAFVDQHVVKFQLPDKTPSGLQGWFFNTRRPQFADPRVRQAIGLAFDYEWTNKTLFYGAYLRTQSYFENSELKAAGKPDAAELALLEPFRGKVPDTVFGEAVSPPVSDGSGHDRTLLRRASDLLTAAGWLSKDGVLQNAQGQRFVMELLDDDNSSERIEGPFVANLKLLGIDATIRTIDASQYQSRLIDFDFDVIIRRFSQTPTPDDGMRDLYDSSRANLKGSQNYVGFNDPVIDALVEAILKAKSRPEMITAGRALDRVLRAGFYMVPHWYLAAHRIAMWDLYARPTVPAAYDRAIEATWWVDAAKAKALDKGL